MREFIIFDLDGTLIDSNAVCVEILQEMLDERDAGLTIDPDAAAVHMSRGGVYMIHAILAEACGDPEAELSSFRERYAERATPTGSLFCGVAEGIERLDAAGFGLAICSNKPENLCHKVLADTGLHERFAAIVGGRLGLRPKPAPDLLHATLAELGASARQCVFVGDSELDHLVAEGAGMPFCFMRYGYATPGWSPAQALCFDRFDALVDMLVTAGPALSDAAAAA